VKITIITVAYNSAATIADALQSVVAQTHPDIEHIVIDGGSKDATEAVVHAEGSRVSQFLSERDEGIYDAMNKGIALATGDFVGFLNADDMLATPDSVAKVAQAAAASGADAVCGDLVYVNKERTNEVVRYWRCGEFSPQRLRFGWMPPHPTLYVRRSRLAELGRFDVTLRIAADYDFMLRYLGHPGMRIAYVPEVLVRMRTGGASNRSLSALIEKSREDLIALRKNRAGGVFTLLCKNARKLPQFFAGPRAAERTAPKAPAV
jgi:glycosyltransferase